MEIFDPYPWGIFVCLQLPRHSIWCWVLICQFGVECFQYVFTDFGHQDRIQRQIFLGDLPETSFQP